MITELKHLDLSQLPSNIDGMIDVFLCSASYEDRCLSVPSIIASKVEVPIICHFRKQTAPAVENLRRLEAIFGNNSVRVSFDRLDPLRNADRLQATLSKHLSDTQARRYLVDITTFTHENLLILLSILRRQVARNDVIDFVYTAAAEYAVGLKPQDKWLSKGVRDVRSVLGYPGTARPSRKSHLVLLVGFEADRALELIESYEPSVLSLGFGDEASATNPGHYSINKMVFRQIASKVSSYGEFSFSTTDPDKAALRIQEQIDGTPDCNVLIAPMNTKLSTLGAASVAFCNSDIRLCYASPLIYNFSAYSRPAKHCYIVRPRAEFWHAPARIDATREAVWTKGAIEYADSMV
jgi:hypothetical protein